MIDDEKIRLQELSYKWLNGTLTDTEQLEFDSWFVHSNIGPLEVPAEVAGDREQYRQLIFSRIREEIGIVKPTKRTKLWLRIGVAAAVIGLAIGVYFYTTPHPELVSGSPNYANDIAPGSNRATLTANGKTINLSDTKTGIDVNASALTYNDGTTIDPSALGMTDGDSRSLEVITPKGGTYSIILQDGTKVWLNADSKLEFFSNYRNKRQRIVKLTGEAYFEVAKNKRQPFIVQSNRQNVTVLGTHFNISAYKGEEIKTTLLEGSVRIASYGQGGKAVTLKPNQQSVVTDNEKITVAQVDPETAIAWKNGYFKFENEPLGSIMQKVSRWYNVEIEYKDESLRALEFGGTVSRYDKVSAVLSKLALTEGVKFKITGNKIIVTK